MLRDPAWAGRSSRSTACPPSPRLRRAGPACGTRLANADRHARSRGCASAERMPAAPQASTPQIVVA